MIDLLNHFYEYNNILLKHIYKYNDMLSNDVFSFKYRIIFSVFILVIFSAILFRKQLLSIRNKKKDKDEAAKQIRFKLHSEELRSRKNNLKKGHNYDNDIVLHNYYNNINLITARGDPLSNQQTTQSTSPSNLGSPSTLNASSSSIHSLIRSDSSHLLNSSFEMVEDIGDGSESLEFQIPQSVIDEKLRIKNTTIQRRSNIIAQPMLEQLAAEKKPTRPRKITVGRPKPYQHHQHTYSLNSANLFNNNMKSPIITSAKVNNSLYIPTNVYGYYKESKENDNNVHIEKIVLTSPPIDGISSINSFSTNSPSLINNNNEKSLDILALENFLVNSTLNNNNNNNNSNNIINTINSNSNSSNNNNNLSSERKNLVSSNYSVDSSIQLRSANDGIKTRQLRKQQKQEQLQQQVDSEDEIDNLYNNRLNLSTNSTSSMLTDYNQQPQQQLLQQPKKSQTTNLLTEQFAISNDSVATNKSLEEDEEEDYCGSDIDGEDFSSVNIDYNERFQEIMQDLRNVDCNAYQHDRVRVNSQFIALTQDFVYASSTFGKVIISERYLPNNEKTIPPIDIGGLAGGDKFIVHGILFKFAIDKENFYGSDYAASCVAGHELKGLINIFNTTTDLSLPLMALVDYRGFRVIAMSILPVAKDTICYGSNDYGMTIHNSDSVLSDSVQEVARQLNIKSHHCGEQVTYLHSPADLEGHLGFDGRYYMLDFARLFPPEAPKKGIKMGHLYRLMRPEFVRNYKLALCSDSFSRFIRGHNDEEHNSETVEATMYLLNTTIPELAEELNHVELNASNIYSFPLSERLHKSGVNIRYLGHVRRLVESPEMKSLIFVEMCARVIKQQLRQKLRYKMKQAKIPLDAPYRRLIVAYLNRILGISDKSDEFWDTKMKKYIMKKFDRGLFDDELSGNSIVLNLFSFEDNLTDGKYLLFKRIQKMTGLKFTTRINEEFLVKPNCWLERGEYPLDINDLEEIGIRVKYVPFMNVAQGYLFKVKGEMLFASDPIAATRFFMMALEKLETALETDPNNTNTLCTMGEVYTHLGVGNSLSLSSLRFSLDNPYVAKAYEYLQRAIFSNRTHTTSLFRFAQLLERLEEVDRAEDYYIAALESNPNNIACLQEYGNFLQTVRGDPFAAEPFFVRVSENHQYLHLTSMKQNELNLRGSSGLLKVKPKLSDTNSSLGNGSSSNLRPGHSRSSSTSSISSSEKSSSSSSYDYNNRLSISQTTQSINSNNNNNFLQVPKLLDKSKSSAHLTTPTHLMSSFPMVKSPPSTPSTPSTTPRSSLFSPPGSSSDINISPPPQKIPMRPFIS